MIVFPHAKINLGLHVKSRRDDGYHEVDTVLFPIRWHDALEAVTGSEFQVQHSTDMPWSVHDDLVTQAVNLLRAQCDLPATQLFLHKHIPVGAGLGGGSSDAAHTLLLLTALHELKLPEGQLHRLASKLGADCPFFLHQGPMWASGTGTELQAVQIRLHDLWLMVVVPNVHIDTAWAYAHIIPTEPQKGLLEIITQPVTHWRDTLTNDFENVIFQAHPVVGKLKQQLYDRGAMYASMSGSGSAVFGLFERKPAVDGFDTSVRLHTERLRAIP